MDGTRADRIEKVISQVDDVKTSLEELSIDLERRDGEVLEDAVSTLDRVGDELDEIQEEK